MRLYLRFGFSLAADLVGAPFKRTDFTRGHEIPNLQCSDEPRPDLSRNAGDDLRNDVIAQVRVRPALAGQLRQRDGEGVADQIEIGLIYNRVETRWFTIEPARMAENLAHGDGVPCARRSGQALGYRIAKQSL